MLLLVEERRGIYKSELARLAGVGWGTAGHHVEQLEFAGKVRTVRVGKFLWVFAANVSLLEQGVIVSTRGRAARVVLMVASLQEKFTVDDVVCQGRLSRKAAKTQLWALEQAGVLRCIDGSSFKLAGV